MVILHIACITNELCKGVCVAVPQHVIAQSEFADVAFINVNNIQIQNISNQLSYQKNNTISELPAPYNEPDIVIFHEVYRPAYLSIYKELNKKKIPYVVVPHGCLTKVAQNNKRIKKVIANIILFNRFIYSAKAIQCLSEQEKQNIRFNVNKFVSGNGINKPSKYKDNFNKLKISFVFIGRIDIKIKGLDILIEAISNVQDFLRDNNASFEIVGSVRGDDTTKLKQLINEFYVSDLVIVTDAIFSSEKEKKILESDIFLLTSRTEGMPMGVIEALNYGVPCIVTQGTSVRKMIQDNDIGWGCDTNVNALSDVIKLSILEKNEWIEKSNRAKNLMENNFRWNTIAFKAIQVYSKLKENN